jgi:hypothetical protein
MKWLEEQDKKHPSLAVWIGGISVAVFILIAIW